ncbi:aldehyde dehydrogenase [Punctularia strigosozonata HHB-11173 SS5]|uniref:aldehyde dehydrogenase n=1 Tax=Punctularia strigosozonata (strain HHB-11173) TaxID=741275 RepID=UPI00044176FA|nr:aldehyde dehydrogenase [Punctularia strigosozonata HHB-11173 SS5]EIN05485.1 aldehyde dehydrogenase [Punctularia strigosozonata HHB-11173 SS5]
MSAEAFKPANNDQIVTDCKELEALFPSSKEKLPHVPSYKGNQYLVNGEVKTFTKSTTKIATAIYAGAERVVISEFARCDKDVALEALKAAQDAWGRGLGAWPRATIQERVKAMHGFLLDYKAAKEQMVELLMWDICKSRKDAEDEIDRTIDFIKQTIDEAIKLYNSETKFEVSAGVAAQIRHMPVGVVLASGPFNYPMNECYTTFIPALTAGNTVIVRIPRNGASPHFPTLELFEKHFPPGVINILSGSGREIMTPLMESGGIDYLAFIGRSTSASALIKTHPEPHRLHVLAQMDSKDCAILLEDADVALAAKHCASGAFSFNGQRCTAMKLVWVHRSIAAEFVPKFAAEVDAMKIGMPWEDGVKITPLCEDGKPDGIRDFVEDALKHGAHILNKNGGRFARSLASPTVVGPVTKEMKLWSEEQFGPVSPVAVFDDVEEPLEWVASSKYGLQSAVFGYDPRKLARVVDALAMHEGRVNINSPDKRGPDVFPFTGKKNSALGMTNAKEALKLFAIPTIVATQVQDERSLAAVEGLIRGGESTFFNNKFVFPPS